jgi:hypothetical protein
MTRLTRPARPGGRLAAGARDAVGAKPPRRVPRWLARLFMGEGLAMMTESRGASNAKANKEPDWTLRYPTWRQGFQAAHRQHQARP